jgi:hypothetical protein
MEGTRGDEQHGKWLEGVRQVLCFLLLLGLVALSTFAEGAEPVGVRPYKLERSGGHEDDYPPLVDFEDLTGWRASGHQAAAEFQRSREQQIWGRHVGKLTYRADGASPVVQILPPAPIRQSHCWTSQQGHALKPTHLHQCHTGRADCAAPRFFL